MHSPPVIFDDKPCKRRGHLDSEHRGGQDNLAAFRLKILQTESLDHFVIKMNRSIEMLHKIVFIWRMPVANV